MKNRGLIAIIDDESVRESLPDLLGVLGHGLWPMLPRKTIWRPAC